MNGRGLDLRLRVPDFITGLEAELRSALGKALGRGVVNLTLRINRENNAAGDAIDEAALHQAVEAMRSAEAAARAAGLQITPVSAAEILAQKGVLKPISEDDGIGPLKARLREDFEALLSEFLASRAREGAALCGIISDQLEVISNLTDQAGNVARSRRDQQADQLRHNLARVLENADAVDEARVAQELAILVVKADVTEELDRLSAHVVAARELLQATDPVGRKLDFLMQEFMREANTLCSKSQNSDLTAIGLDLKTVIDQMREQVQNLE